MTPNNSSGAGDTVGVNPDLLRVMIDDLERNAAALQDAILNIKGRFEYHGLAVTGAGEIQVIRNIGDWAHAQVPLLKSRYDLARALQDPGRRDTMVQYLEGASSGAEVPLIQLPPPEPDGKRDAKKVADWWKGLTTEQRMAWLEREPKLIGGLAGVPTPMRDYANRRALDRTIQELEREKESLKAKYGKIRAPLIKLQSLQERLDGCNKLKQALEDVVKDKRNHLDESDVYLLDFDPNFANGDGRAVVALGDPSTAKDVGVIVPGMTNTLNDLPDRVGDAAGLRAELGPEAAKGTATIAWLGYDPPDNVGIVSAGQAEAGAKELQQFVKDLRDTNGGTHIAVFGHSYGSLVTGSAARDGLAADDVVLYGSPGAGVDRASELKLRQGHKEHVWVARAVGDETAGVGLGFPHGLDPMSDKFGARRVPLDPTQNGHDHKLYLKRGTEGLKNFARILTRDYSNVGPPPTAYDEPGPVGPVVPVFTL